MSKASIKNMPGIVYPKWENKGSKLGWKDILDVKYQHSSFVPFRDDYRYTHNEVANCRSVLRTFIREFFPHAKDPSKYLPAIPYKEYKIYSECINMGPFLGPVSYPWLISSR